MSSITTELLKERTGLEIKFSTLEELYALQDALTELLPPRTVPKETGVEDSPSPTEAVEKPKKVKKATKAVPKETDLLAPADADATGGSAPTLGATDSLRDAKHRLQVLNPALCVGRKIDEDNVLVGTRPGDEGAKGKVFPEIQCSRKPIAGARLCANCVKKETECHADADKVPKGWYGRLDEPLFSKAYVVGCEWFWSKYPEGIEGARPDASSAPAVTTKEKTKKASKKAVAVVEPEVVAETVAVVAEEAPKVKKASKKAKAEEEPEVKVEAVVEVETVAVVAEEAPKVKKASKKPKAEETTTEEATKPAKASKATVADSSSARDVEWVTFMHEGVPLIRNTKTGNCYQCDRAHHRLEDMVCRDKYEGKWRKGRLDPYAEEDDE